MNELANHYATALYELAAPKSRGAYDKALAEVKQTINASRDLSNFLRSYSFSLEEKEKAIDAVFGSKYDLPYFCDTLKVIAAHHRFDLFDDIVGAYHSLYNEATGVKEGIVYSAMPLKENEQKAMEEVLGKKLGAKVELSNVVDPHLLGGAKIAIDDKVFDGSLRSKLNDLHAQLRKGGNQ